MDIGIELNKVVRDNLPGHEELRHLTARIVGHWLDILKQTSAQFTDQFVGALMSGIPDASDLPMLLPEGTRYHYQAKRFSVLVIEQKPTVRTLNFRLPGVNSSFRLAFPYILFLPVFVFQNGRFEFSSLCVAYRNSPITSLNDLLYHPNLPNLSSGEGVWRAEGDLNAAANGWQGLVACNGNLVLNPTDINTMTGELLAHFWNSSFTHELATNFYAMQATDERFVDLETWEKNSRLDPLFPLKVKWFPAIRLSRFLTSVEQHFARKEETKVKALTQSYVASLICDTWSKVAGSSMATRQTLERYVSDRLEGIFSRFAELAARGLMVIDNTTVRKTILFAVADAIKAATRKEP